MQWWTLHGFKKNEVGSYLSFTLEPCRAFGWWISPCCFVREGNAYCFARKYNLTIETMKSRTANWEITHLMSNRSVENAICIRARVHPYLDAYIFCSDLTDNQFTAGLPSFHPKAPLGITLLHKNYFDGGMSNLNRSGACISPSSTVTLASNCLGDRPSPCDPQEEAGTTCSILEDPLTVIQGRSFTHSSPSTSMSLLPSPIQLFNGTTCQTASLSTSFSLCLQGSVGSTGRVTFAILPSIAYARGNLGFGSSDAGISIEFNPWDPHDNHIGLNIGGRTVSVASASLNSSLLGPGPTYVWITYDAQEMALRVYASKQTIWPDVPVLRYYFSLCVALRPQPLTSTSTSFVGGFSAAGAVQVRNWCLSTCE